LAQELAYILGFSGCSLVIVENEEQLKKVYSVHEKIPGLKRFIVLDPDFTGADTGRVKVSTYAEVIADGAEFLESKPDFIEKEIEQGREDDTATIIFTSGTTGEPKGVVLSHRNFLYQVGCIPDRINVTPGDIWICVLPVWHSFERIVQSISPSAALPPWLIPSRSGRSCWLTWRQSSPTGWPPFPVSGKRSGPVFTGT
jgi:long-chain acyl-CoA synthetase